MLTSKAVASISALLFIAPVTFADNGVEKTGASPKYTTWCEALEAHNSCAAPPNTKPDTKPVTEPVTEPVTKPVELSPPCTERGGRIESLPHGRFQRFSDELCGKWAAYVKSTAGTYTCKSTYEEMCPGRDHPDGSEYNNVKFDNAGCKCAPFVPEPPDTPDEVEPPCQASGGYMDSSPMGIHYRFNTELCEKWTAYVKSTGGTYTCRSTYNDMCQGQTHPDGETYQNVKLDNAGCTC